MSTNYERRGRYIVPVNDASKGAGVPGKHGSTVYRTGCDLNAAMYPIEPERHDPTADLLRALEAQRRARQNT